MHIPAILKAITYSDVGNIIRKRENPYTCAHCGKELDYEEFAVLPAIKGFLVCSECYRAKSEMSFKDNAFCGGFIIDILNTKETDRYSFSHGSKFVSKGVAYNEKRKFFIVRQEVSDIGDVFSIMRIPTSVAFDNEKLIAFEATHNYSTLFHGLFHPFLLYPQFTDINDDDIIMKHLKECKCLYK